MCQNLQVSQRQQPRQPDYSEAKLQKGALSKCGKLETNKSLCKKRNYPIIH